MPEFQQQSEMRMSLRKVAPETSSATELTPLLHNYRCGRTADRGFLRSLSAFRDWRQVSRCVKVRFRN